MKFKLAFKHMLLSVLLLFTFSLGFADSFDNDVINEYGYYPDFASYQRVLFIGNRLANAAGLKNASFQVINDDSYNAFALPDGRIYINSRLLCDGTDAEIAFILGHEITHVVQKHSSKQMQSTLAALLLGYLGAKVVGANDDDAATTAGVTAALVSGQYSQKDEKRSDEGGIKYMTMIGYDPHDAAGGMKLILDRYGRGEASIPILGLFSSHPDTQKRYNNLVEIAKKYETKPPKQIDYVQGAAIKIAPYSLDKDSWILDYSIALVPDATKGRVAIIPPQNYKAPIVPDSMIRTNYKDIPKSYVRRNYTITPYHQKYDITISTSVTDKSTDVVTIIWNNLVNGQNGYIVGESSPKVSKNNTTGVARTELLDPIQLIALSDGINHNVEGTSVASALRRAWRIFAEVADNNGKVIDHSIPYNVKLDQKKYNVGDYIYIIRKNSAVGEAKVIEFTAKDTASVKLIWGDKIDKKDSFAKAE